MRLKQMGYCLTLLAATLSACKSNTKTPDKPAEAKKFTVISPAFDADSAYVMIEKQVAFGPRIPNLSTHKKCADWIVAELKTYGATVIEQPATVTAWDGTKLNIRNIIAQTNPAATQRIMISAHWDSRKWADEDQVDPDKPIDAANDAGSGVAVMMEMARVLQKTPAGVGVDFFFWDAEDYGKPDHDNSYCYGSQHWSRNKHVADYKPLHSINLDMVGATGATFLLEEGSVKYAAPTAMLLWGLANDMGYGQYFSYQQGPAITDDHLYVTRIGGIPAIDVIDMRIRPDGLFFEHWHTHGDNMACISKETLKAVGQSLLELVFRQKVS